MQDLKVVNTETLDSLFNPKEIAVIGASAKQDSIGGRPIKSLLKAGYEGAIYPVNPKYDSILGLNCYKTIEELPKGIDLAIIALAKNFVLDAMKQCAKQEVKSVIIFSAGFNEVDEEGGKLQEEIVRVAKEHNIRILGPNCIGLFNVNNGVYANFMTAIETGPIIKGRIGFVSQSGAILGHLFTLARDNQIGFSSIIATGNEADVDVADCIAYFAEDPSTDVIACYIEGSKDGQKLINALKLASKNKKPVIALKVGRSETGRKAAMSHTASLVGSDEVYDAIFKQYGVYRADSMQEFLDVAYACSVLPLPKDDRVGIFTVSGGVGILMADQLSEHGLELPEPSPVLQKKLKEIIPYAAVQNPIDTTAQIVNQPQLMGDFMKTVLETKPYDVVTVFLSTFGLFKDTLKQQLLAFEELRQLYPDVPIILVALVTTETKKMIDDSGLVVFEDPTRAVNVVKAITSLNHAFENQNSIQIIRSKKIDVNFENQEGTLSLTEAESKKIIQSYNIPISRERLVLSAEETIEVANEIGYPVVIKGMSPQIQHKTDLGLVHLNIKNDSEAEEAFHLIKDIISKVDNAEFQGVLVQEMLNEKSWEFIIGTNNDPIFGPMVMVGLGGIYVEMFKDVSIRKAPVTLEVAKQMVDELRGASLLKGMRNQEKADLQELYSAIVSLSELAYDQKDKVLEIDINPLLVFSEGRGVKAVDALIQLKY